LKRYFLRKFLPFSKHVGKKSLKNKLKNSKIKKTKLEKKNPNYRIRKSKKNQSSLVSILKV
jgi:hypothetical protein